MQEANEESLVRTSGPYKTESDAPKISTRPKRRAYLSEGKRDDMKEIRTYAKGMSATTYPNIVGIQVEKWWLRLTDNKDRVFNINLHKILEWTSKEQPCSI